MARLDNRKQAGRQLAQLLTDTHGSDHLMITAISVDSLPVARAFADALESPLTTLLTRELTSVQWPSPVYGAIASPDVLVLDYETARASQISDQSIEVLEKRERKELERIEQELGDAGTQEKPGESVMVLVLDCLRSPSSVQAALQVLGKKVDQVIIAAPFAATPAVSALEEAGGRVLYLEADEVLSDCFSRDPSPRVEQARDYLLGDS